MTYPPTSTPIWSEGAFILYEGLDQYFYEAVTAFTSRWFVRFQRDAIVKYVRRLDGGHAKWLSHGSLAKKHAAASFVEKAFLRSIFRCACSDGRPRATLIRWRKSTKMQQCTRRATLTTLVLETPQTPECKRRLSGAGEGTRPGEVDATRRHR